MQWIAIGRSHLKALRSACATLLLMMALITTTVHADVVTSTSLFPDDPYSVFTTVKGGAQMSYKTVDVSGPGFDHALQMTTLHAPQSPYSDGESSILLAGAITSAVNQGDALLVTFWARAAKPGKDGYAYSSFQYENIAGSFEQTAAIKVNRDWKKYQFPFKAAASYQPGAADISFSLGYNPQTLQVGGLSALDYGATPPSSYPSITYDGRDPNAAWREEAQERIQKYREGDVKVIVKDPNGKPVPNAIVHVDMQRQAFEFGSAVDASWLRSNTPDGEKYRSIVSQLFNTVTLGNDLKWPEWEDQIARNNLTLPALEWLLENNFNVRGHNLVWPSWQWLPSDVPSLSGDPAALNARVDNHILDETSALRGKVVSWDVFNEPYSNHDLQDILGNQVEADWFKLAQQGDPNTPLFINDYNNLEHDGARGRQMDFYYNTIQTLLKEKAPVSGIGLQSHFNDLQPTSPTELLQVLDRYGKLGLPMQVTEFDFNTTDQQLQADYTRDFLTMVYSDPQVDGITEWGFWQSAHWRPDGASYLADWTEKPNGKVWEDLVRHLWWTNAQGMTNDDGVYKTRGFLGDYNVSVTVNGVTKTVPTTLSRDGRTLTVIADGKSQTPPPPSHNLVLNAGFEAGNVGWTSIGSGANVVKDAHSGTSALQTGTAAGGSSQDLIDVHAGTNYTLSGWGKASGPNTTCWVGVRGGQYPGLPSYIRALPITEQQYTQHSLSYTVPANVTWQEVFAWKDAGDGVNTCTFDDISFAPTVGPAPPDPGPPAVGPQLPPEPSLLSNGDFELGTNGWYCFGPCTLSTTSNPVYSGKSAALITNRSATWQGVGQNVTSQVANGGTYQTSAWVRTAAGAGAATGVITLKVTTSTGTNYYGLGSAAINDSGWTQIQSAPIKITWTGNLQSAEWYVSTSDTLASLVVDDATLNAVPAPTTTELLTNPGFEQSTSGWYCFGPCSLNTTGNPVHSGNAAALITNRSATWQGVGQNVTSQLKNGGTYQTSAWVRTPSGAGAANAGINIKIVDDSGTHYYGIAFTGVNDSGWTQIQSTPFQITWTGTLQSAEWYVNTSDNPVDLIVDDASLTLTT